MTVGMMEAASFDEATRVTAAGDGRYAAAVNGDYNIGTVPNGGYVMAIAQRAICARLPGRAPLTMTAHFLRPAAVAPARVDVEVLREGRRYATARARLWQGDHEVVSAIATLLVEPVATPVELPSASRSSAITAAVSAAWASSDWAAVSASASSSTSSTAAAAAGAGSSPPAPLHLVDGAPPQVPPLDELVP